MKHYTIAAQLSALVDSAIMAAEQNTAFAEENPQVINGLKTYQKKKKSKYQGLNSCWLY